MLKKAIFMIICFNVFYSAPNLDYYLHIYSANRLSDGSMINIPFRLADIDFSHENKNISVISRLSFEYNPRYSDFYTKNSSSDEFLIDLRELYVKWYFDNLELSIGKQIHTWGATDQNSPLDNASPYDYYYIFSNGTEQKMGAFSGALTYYLDNIDFGVVFSPMHHTNRLPLGGNDFPIELPVKPRPELISNVENTVEFGGYLRHSFDMGDIGLSYYKGNDRVFNLSGVNIFNNEANSSLSPGVDTVLCYRQTEVVGLSATAIINPVTFRLDHGYFYTKDLNTDETIHRDRPDMQNHPVFGIDAQINPITGQSSSSWYEITDEWTFQEEAYYSQTTLQLEVEYENLYSVIGFFNYEIQKYDAEKLEAVNLPGVDADIDPQDYFYPGLGAPLAILTSKALMYSFKQNIGGDSDVELILKGLVDLNDDGFLTELGAIFNLSDDLRLHTYLNKIIGDDSLDDEYRFNQMKDFSHLRFELEYFF